MKKRKIRIPVEMMLAVLLASILMFPPQHIVAFADVIGGQEENTPADIPETEEEEEEASSEDSPEPPQDEETVADEDLDTAPESEEDLDTAPESEDGLDSLETPEDGFDATIDEIDEAISPFAVTTVTTEAAFRTALADVTITEIYLGANISMSAAVSATVANRPLVISGVDPSDPNGTVHTYADYPSATAGYGGLTGTCVDLTFRDLNVTLSNYYGIYSTAAANKTVTFDNVTGTAPQFFHYYSASAGSTFIVQDSNLTLGFGYLSTIGEFAEADRVIFRGSSTVTRAVPTAFNIFLLAGTYASVIVEDGSNVVIDNTANTTAGGAIFYAANAISIGNNATFYCYTAQGFMGAGFPAISVGQFSDVKFIYTGTAARAAYLLQATSFSVGLQSRVLVYDNSSSVYGALFVAGSVTLNNPRNFVVLNANSAVMGFAEPTNITGNQLTSIRYFSGASQIAAVYDPVSREYIGTDASPFLRWWVQNSLFNVSANYWPTNAPLAVTSSPVYSAANVPAPALAAGAATSLTSNNFGLYNGISYGYAFVGQTNANIRLEYFFDGVIDSSRTTAITPLLTSTVNVSDVALATPPVGYTLSGTPTTPALPASAQSLDGQTVRVDYITDSEQTASIDVDYYFNGVHNTIEDATITPQILSTVTVSDVALSTVPPGYMLSSTPTAPVLPASAQSLNGTTVNVYYVTDPAQTATINLEYFFNGILDTGYSTTITPQLLSTLGVAQVALASVPVGYTLSSTPTSPVLPASAQSLDGQTVSVFYVTDPSQTASIDVHYFFNGAYNASDDATITPQILSTVNVSDVALTTVPVGYTLSSTPTSPALPASAQSLDNTVVNVYYVTDPAQTATINVEYYFNGTLDPAYNATINPQVLSTVGVTQVALATVPAGYTLSSTPTSPVLPASAQSLDGQTVSVYYVTDPAQTASIAVEYYFNGTHNAARDTTINPQLLSTVGIAQVTLSTVPAGYMLSSTPSSPVLPASAQGLNGTTVSVYYVTDPSQTATIQIEYYFNGTLDPSYNATINPQILSVVSIAQVGLATVPVGYTLDTPSTSPVLPATAVSLNNTTVSVYYVTDPAQTASISIAYYFNGILDPSYYASITPQILSTVEISDVALASTPAGYMLSSTPTSPVLPASAQSLNGQTVNVYYVADPAQTATINVEYYFDGTLDPAFNTSITRQVLESVALADVALASTPAGYMLASVPTSPTLPALAQNLNGQTVSVYYVADPAQTATITLNYYFNGIHNASYDTAINPQLLTTVVETDVTLETVPTGYMLSSTPTSPVLPASAQSLNGQTVNVYYVTDPAQTATINVEYYFDGTLDPAFNTSITRQVLASVALADIELTPVPVGYTLDVDPTNPILPQTAESLDGTTISVFYVLDLGQTATIDIGYYFDGVLNASYTTTINPQILTQVTEAEVLLASTPAGYMLDTPATVPTLPASAQELNNTTVNVFYVTDPSQTASIDLEYFFDGTYDPGYDATITPQVLAVVGLSSVVLASVPAGYTLATTPTSPVLPESAQSLDGTTISVYYVTDTEQTATISVGYYFNDILDSSYSTTINPQLLDNVELSDVTLGTVPVGYQLSTTPTSPALPASAQSLNGTTVNVYYVTDPAQTATITLNYYFNGIYDPSYDATITPQILSSVSLASVSLASTPVGFMLSPTPTDPVLPASAQSLNNTTVNVYYETNPSQTVTINIAYYLNGTLNTDYNATITPHILSEVTTEDVVLSTTPVGYMLDTPATVPALPASAQSLSGTTVNVYYVTDPAQTVTITLNYYFNGSYDPSFDTTITPQVLSTVGVGTVSLAVVPPGYTLATIPTLPVLPESAQNLAGSTVNVYYVSDADQRATISVGYYFNGVLNSSYSTIINPQLLSSVNVSDVTLATVPSGYVLDAPPTVPALPASAQSLNGTTVNVYYVTDPAQTATISLNYYFNGSYDPSFDATITPQVLSTVGISDVALSPAPAGYILSSPPTVPTLPENAQNLDNTTVNIYYVTDPAQTATISVNYYLNGAHNASLDTVITPQILSAVTLSQVVLSTTPTGYMLDTPPTIPVLPASAQSLDGTTVNVYYVTDPTQTATIYLEYYFDGSYDPGYDTVITPQLLSTVGITQVTLPAPPVGYILSTPPTDPALPTSTQSLDGTTIRVYYEADPTQTASITINYYLNGTQDTSLDTSITPQILSTVTVADVALPTPPVGYMLDPVPTDPVLPESAENLDGTTISVFYVSDPDQVATIDIEYYFNGSQDSSYDSTITPQILESVSLVQVILDPAPVGYMLDTPASDPALPESAQSLDGTTIRVYYVTDPTQTASITLNYYFNGSYDPSYDSIITPQVLEEVTLAEVVLTPVPSGFMLGTPATSPVLPVLAASLDNNTIAIYYVSIRERITASDFRYAIASGPLSGFNALVYAQVLAYDAEGNPIPASLITVDAAQLAAINAAIASGDLSGNPYPLTFYTPDGSSITINVTLFNEGSNNGVSPGGGQEPAVSLLSKLSNLGDGTIYPIVSVVAMGLVLGGLSYARYRLHKARKRP